MDLGALLLDVLGEVVSNPLVVTGAAILGAALVAGWLLATVWAFHDMASRSDSLLARYAAATWLLLSGPALLPFSLAILGAVRPVQTPADRRLAGLIRALEARAAEVQQCRACRGRIEASWVRCPWCATWLGRQCQRCDRWVPTDADVCPWCLWEPGEALPSPALSMAPARSMPVGINAPALDGRAPGRVDPDAAPRTA